MSCNIRFENPHDGNNDWPHRKDFLSELIKSRSPDLLGTQEGREPQLRSLEKLLEDYEILDQHRDWIEVRMYPTIFLRKEKFKILNSGDIWLSETPQIPGSSSFNSAFPRLCTYAHLLDLKNDTELLYINCHLDHVREETRVEQARVLTTEVQKLSLPKEKILISGDFNSRPDGKVREIIRESLGGLVDPWKFFGYAEETSFHKFDGVDPDNSKSRIDWILCGDLFKPSTVELIKDNKNGSYPSDHFFIYAEFKL